MQVKVISSFLKIRNLSVFVILFYLMQNAMVCNAFNLSKKAEISILTCSPGDEMYSVYGHSAIRVKDAINNYDVVFNYGIFDYSTPNFLYRFARGQTDYLLGAYDFPDFLEEYVADKRSIFEQVLDLTQVEKQKVFDFLLWNAKPENRVYRYNFFFDNCATRVRDVIAEQVDGKVAFNERNHVEKTFRQLIKEYHSKLKWLNFGIDLVVAAPADKIASVYEEMFLPDYLMAHFSTAVIEAENGTRSLVKSSRPLYTAPGRESLGIDLLCPFVVFLVLLILVTIISVNQFRKNNLKYGFDYLIYGINGLMGIILLWFVLYSEHPAMRPNYNLLWVIPLNLAIVIVWRIKRWRNFTRYFHVAITIWLILFILLGFLLPQKFHIAFYLLILTVLCRSVLHSLNILKQIVKVKKN
jgi:hypothetical protein